MIDIATAKELAEKEISEIQKKSNIPLSIMCEETIEFEFGWMFFYQSEAFVKTGDLKFLVGGNAPLIVDKFNSTIHRTGTRMDEKFYIQKYSQFRDDLERYKMEIS